MKRTRIAIAAIGIVVALAAPTAAHASSAPASCVGQQVSALGPAYGAELGAAVSFEARHPEVLGATNLGGWASYAATSDPTACPAED
jgi:hypothetical protein